MEAQNLMEPEKPSVENWISLKMMDATLFASYLSGASVVVGVALFEIVDNVIIVYI